MAQDMYVETISELSDTIQGYLADTLYEDETFCCGIISEGGILRSGPVIAVTSKRLIIVQKNLIDTSGKTIRSGDIEQFRFEQSDHLVQFTVELERTSVDFTLTDFPEPFADQLIDVFSGVTLQIDLSESQTEQHIDPAEQVEQAFEAAAYARKHGDIETAIAKLETAIEWSEQVDSADQTYRVEILKKHANSLREIKNVRENVERELTKAESSFHTAISAHVSGQKSLARIRYRQAREQYNDVLAAINSAPKNVLYGGLDIQTTFEGDRPPREISKIHTTNDIVLSDQDRDAVDEYLGSIANLSMNGISELHQNVSLDGEFGGLLLVLAWWNDGEIRAFENTSTIELLERLAAVGFASCK
jgi:tetratricopeptide (TPR) repeat protein